MDMADEDEGLEETLAALGERETTWGVILRESSKAIALQIASPLATLVEVAVVGRKTSTVAPGDVSREEREKELKANSERAACDSKEFHDPSHQE